MMFFYQLISKDPEGKRLKHIHKIKANGGMITSELRDATFIILAPQSSIFYDPSKKECQAMDRIALKASFIDACVEEGSVVDEDDFILDWTVESSPKKKGRGRPTTHRIYFPNNNTSNTATPKPKPKESIPADLLERLPYPPSPSPNKNGTNKFTHDEKCFALKCAAVIFRKDIHSTNKNLFSIIAERCPNHSENMWRHHASSHWMAELEKVRSRAMDEMPGEDSPKHEQSYDSTQVDPEDDDADAEGEDDDDVQEILLPEREFTAGELETDLQNITKYFAAEPEGSDEELWVGLTRKHKCLTARSWQEFYQRKNEEVNARLRDALNISE